MASKLFLKLLFDYHSSSVRVSSSSGSLGDVQSHRDYWLERDYYSDAIIDMPMPMRLSCVVRFFREQCPWKVIER